MKMKTATVLCHRLDGTSCIAIRIGNARLQRQRARHYILISSQMQIISTRTGRFATAKQGKNRKEKNMDKDEWRTRWNWISFSSFYSNVTAVHSTIGVGMPLNSPAMNRTAIRESEEKIFQINFVNSSWVAVGASRFCVCFSVSTTALMSGMKFATECLAMAHTGCETLKTLQYTAFAFDVCAVREFVFQALPPLASPFICRCNESCDCTKYYYYDSLRMN